MKKKINGLKWYEARHFFCQFFTKFPSLLKNDVFGIFEIFLNFVLWILRIFWIFYLWNSFYRIFGQKCKFWSNMKILVKNANFGQKCKFWSKMQILVKNVNFGQKCKFSSKMQIFVKNANFSPSRISGQSWNFFTKFPSLLKTTSLESRNIFEFLSSIFSDFFLKILSLKFYLFTEYWIVPLFEYPG